MKYLGIVLIVIGILFFVKWLIWDRTIYIKFNDKESSNLDDDDFVKNRIRLALFLLLFVTVITIWAIIKEWLGIN